MESRKHQRIIKKIIEDKQERQKGRQAGVILGRGEAYTLTDFKGRTVDSSGLSAEGTVISVSTVHQLLLLGDG